MAQRGKGTFYCGVGLLVFFIGTGNGGWGLNHVAALLLALVGLMHACAAPRAPRPFHPPPSAHGTVAAAAVAAPRRRRFKVIKEASTQGSDIASAFPPVEATVDVSPSAWNDLRVQAEAEHGKMEMRT